VKPPAKLASHLKRISNPDRVVFPDAGITKAEVAAYYIAVAGRMLPYLKDRPVSFVRAPEGLSGERFFQRHALPGMEKGIASRPDPEDDDGVMVIESLDGLVTAAQFGVIEIHGWGATFPDIGKVERVVFDLDPDEEMDFAVVREGAMLVRDLLKAAALDSVPLLSGGKGVHVVVPLDRSQGWEEIGEFAEGVARGLAAAEPDRFVATVAKAARKGRIFIDYLRNKRTATAIAPWSLRARPGASVAVPVTWKELESAASAAPFTLREAVTRKDPWPRLWKDGQSIPAAALDVLKAGRR
jgi:bifunctional non-homologous end joining protein LigD